jgi:hypothetical protein
MARVVGRMWEEDAVHCRKTAPRAFRLEVEVEFLGIPAAFLNFEGRTQ